MARTKCELTSSVCDVLLKCNVSNLDAGAYLQEDVELVVAAYVGFLSAVAANTHRLNTTLVAASANAVLGVSDSTAKRFADAMSEAFRYCIARARQTCSGNKLSQPVVAVMLSFKGLQALEALQSALRQDKSILAKETISRGSSSSSSSSSCSSPQLPLSEQQHGQQQQQQAQEQHPVQQQQQVQAQQQQPQQQHHAGLVRQASILKLYGAMAKIGPPVLEVHSSDEGPSPKRVCLKASSQKAICEH